MIYTYQKKLKGKQVGIVFGTFAPLHQGHLDVIMRAKKENDGGCIVIVDGRDRDRGGELMPLKKRYRYVREFFADDDLVAVYPIDETELGIEAYPNGWDKFMAKVEEIIQRATYLCEAVFYVSEEEYATHLTDLGYEVVKLDRTLNPISATMIRQNPIKYWDKITFPFRRVFSTNILICGTASEGKTTLVKDLGEYLIENNICKARPSLDVEAVSRITTIEEDMFTPEQVRKMTREEVRDNYKKIIESMKYWN